MDLLQREDEDSLELDQESDQLLDGDEDGLELSLDQERESRLLVAMAVGAVGVAASGLVCR